MKFVLEEGDQRVIDNFDELCEKTRGLKALFEGEVYGFDFKVVDEAKANNFFYTVFPTAGETHKEFTEATGIRITRLNLDINRALNDTRDVLVKALEDIDKQLHNEELIHGTNEGDNPMVE